MTLHKGSMTQISSVSEQGKNLKPMWQGLLSFPHQELSLIVGLRTSNLGLLKCCFSYLQLQLGTVSFSRSGWDGLSPQVSGVGKVILLATLAHTALCEDLCRDSWQTSSE